MQRSAVALGLALALSLGLAVARAQDSKPGGSSVPDAPGSSPGDDADKTLVLDAPKDWAVEPPRGGMGPKVSYKLPAAEGDSEGAVVALYYFKGAGGTFEQNVKRWRDQFKTADGLPFPADKVKTDKVDAKGLEIRTAELSGTFTPPSFFQSSEPKAGFRMIAAVIDGPGGPWFTRLIGPEKSVEKHRAAYKKWLESAHRS